MARLVDLSHTVEHGLVTYPGLPAPVVTTFLTREDSRRIYAEGTEFHIGRIEMVANTGTYVDSPRSTATPRARTSPSLPLECVAHLDGLVVRNQGRAITAAAFDGLDARRARRAGPHRLGPPLGHAERYFHGHPFLTRDAARTSGRRRRRPGRHRLPQHRRHRRPRRAPSHSVLLAAGIPIAEHLCDLDALPGAAFRFYAVPVKVRDFGTFPVRAFAVIA